jgi:hypothetical protein
MSENRGVRTLPLVLLGVSLLVPFGASCTGNANNQPNSAANANQPPPPGYPAYTAAAPPPGYPQQPGYYPPPQPGYAPAQPTQPGYPPPAQPPAQPTYAASPPGYPPSPQPQTPPAPAGSQPAPPPPLAPTDPNTLQGIIQGLQGALQGQTVAPGSSLPGDLTEAGLKLHAVHVAPGMQPDGAELKQSLTEGQHAVMMLTLQAGKCYAVVGFSPPGGIKDLDLNLLAPPFFLTLAGQDLTHNSMPVIGASPSPMCPVLAFPLQYKLDVFARSGSGEVAVQLYSKNK